MTASTLVRPLPESAAPDHNTTEPRHAHTPTPNPDRPHRRNRNDRGFSMLELLVGMVILGILGAIGYGIYTNFIGDARDTALDQNIQTAAAELQSVLALEPTLAGTPALVTAMTNRTNFVWDGTLWGVRGRRRAGHHPISVPYECDPGGYGRGSPHRRGHRPGGGMAGRRHFGGAYPSFQPRRRMAMRAAGHQTQHDRHHRHRSGRHQRRCDSGGVARYLVRRRVGCGDGRASRLLACRRPPWFRDHQRVNVRLRFRRCGGNVRLLAERCPDVGHPR